MFKQVVFDSQASLMTEALLQMIEQERNDVFIERSTIKAVVDIYIAMGLGKIDVYLTDFEAPYLEASRLYYGTVAASLIQDCSFSEYINRVDEIIEREQVRARYYLQADTEIKLVRVCMKVVVRIAVLSITRCECSY